MKFTDLKTAISFINEEVTVFWMRRDLRVHDNAALYHALKENGKVIPLFIFDSVILDALEDKHDRRVEFILVSLYRIQEELQKLKTSLLVLHGNPVEIFKKLKPKCVYTNHDFESYAIKRDESVKKILEAKAASFHTFKDHVIFEKREVVKSDGTPYTVFTPYSRQWKKQFKPFHIKAYPCDKYFKSFISIDTLPLPELKDIGFQPSGMVFPDRVVKTSIIKSYHATRDFPAIDGTTRLGIHLRFGTISIRQLAGIAFKKNDTWLNELIWRDFYSMILYNFPHVEHGAFKPVYDHLPWRNNEREFNKWCAGETGYPLVDAGMRELNATGYMHNRVRMVAASFLTKHLLVDWRWGEAYFASKLLDFDLASNNGGWQWAAGSGCDAAPYFRIFNPALQSKRFDKENEYIKKWIPELGTDQYADPIVDHSFARDRAINTYKTLLG